MIRIALMAMLPLLATIGTASAQILPGSSAATPATPYPTDPGRSGQMVLLPQGGQGVTFGGTPYTQMIGTPNGAAIMVPSGGGSAAISAPGGAAH